MSIESSFEFRRLLLGGVAACATIASQPALAQTKVFDVPAQPAATGVAALARQADVQVLISAADAQGRRVNAVRGAYPVGQALSLLLADTGLAAQATGPGAYTVVALRRPAAAQVQDGRATVTGAIIDPATGEYMRNAIVRVTPSDGERRSVTSGERGEYRLTDLPVGSAEVTVSFTGYADQTTAVVIPASGSVQLDFSLARTGAGAVILSDVIVTATQRDGDARAIMNQRQSMNIMNSLSSESFGEISEGNVGEFIKLMPGVDADMGDGTTRYVSLRGLPSEYASVTVDGVSLASAEGGSGAGGSRSFSFEQASLSNIAAIEISKTASADMDANAPAGTINLRTRRAFDRRGRRVQVEVSGTTQSDLWGDNRTYGNPGDGAQDRVMPSARFEYSDTFFNRRLGVVFSASEYNTLIARDAIVSAWNYAPTTASPDPVVLTALRAQQIKQQQERLSTALNLDFRATENLILSLSSTYNESETWNGQRSWRFTTQGRSAGLITEDPLLEFTTRHADARYEAESLAIVKRGEGLTVVPSFEYRGRRFRLDGRLAYSDSSSSYDPLAWRGSVYGVVNQPRADSNFHAERSDLIGGGWVITQTAGSDWGDPTRYVDQPSALTFETQDGRWAEVSLTSADLNLSYDTSLFGVPTVLKTGLKSRRDAYDFGNERAAHRYTYTGPLSVSEFWAAHRTPAEIGFRDDGLYVHTLSGAAPLMPSNYLIGQLFLSNPEQFRHTITANDYYTAFIANRRHFEEDMNAVYGMATMTFNDRLTVRAGLRWEETRTRSREPDALSYAEVVAAGYAASSATGRATTIEGLKHQYQSRPYVDRSGRYDEFFPSVSVRYVLGDDTDVQLGYSRTIRRPEVSQLAGVWTVNEDTLIVSLPNPGLEPELSDNLSLRLSHYFEPVGLLSVNLFQNRIDGAFVAQDMTAAEAGYTGGAYDDYTFRQLVNVGGEALTVQGAELEFKYALDFLPELLRGFVVGGSYTYNDVSQPTAGVATNMAVLNLTYRRDRLGFSLNSKWVDDKLYTVSNGTYIKARTEMNLSGTYQLRAGWQAFFAARNLLDEPYVRIVPGGENAGGAYPAHSTYFQKFGRTGTVGLRVTF